MANNVPPAPGKIRSTIWRGSPNATGDGTPRLEELYSDVDLMIAPFSASGPLPRCHYFFDTGYSVPGTAPFHVLDNSFRRTVESAEFFARNCELRIDTRPRVGPEMRFAILFANLHRTPVRLPYLPKGGGVPDLTLEVSEWRADGLITTSRYPLLGGDEVPGRAGEYAYAVPGLPHVG